MTLIEIARNLFGAGGGHVHPTAAAAAVYAFNVVHAMQLDGLPDSDVPDAYKYAFGAGMGWTREETDGYWSTAGTGLGTEASVDAYDTYVQWMRTHSTPTAPER